MKAILLLLTLMLTGCGLTPKQLEALDGAMCTKTSGYGITNTTTITAGPNKREVNGSDCSIK